MKYHVKQQTIPAPIMKTMRVPAAEREKITARLQSSLAYIATGKHPGIVEWQDLADVVNIIECLAHPLYLLDKEETLPTVTAATDSMVAAAHRYRETGSMRLDGPGLNALRTLVDWYDASQRHFSLWHMTEAKRLVEAQVRAALHGKARQGVEVVSL